MRRIIATLALIVIASIGLHAQDRPEFHVSRAASPPKLDGVLADEVWKQAPLPLSDWISYNPLRGAKTDQRTEVRIAYDDRNIYFAFHCFDTEPGKIRTTLSRRDTAFN